MANQTSGSMELLPDSDLLTRFVSERDEEAFAELVRRHGRMVLAVCHQVLRRHHDAQDAFQATFLILATRSHLIRRENSVASWLYRVAYRVSMRSAKQRKNRDAVDIENECAAERDDPLQTIYEQSLQTALHEELSRLPNSYQAPLVLCYLKGMSRTEAADALECTASSVKARLARAKKMLRVRLSRRGVAMSVAMAAVAARMTQAAAAPPVELLSETVRICLCSATGTTVQLTPDIASLIQQGNRWMIPFSKTAAITTAASVALVSCLWLSEATSTEPQDRKVTVQAASNLADKPVRSDALPVQFVADDGSGAPQAASTNRFAFFSANPTSPNAMDASERARIASEIEYAKKKSKAYFQLRDAQLEKARAATTKADSMEARAIAMLHEAEAEKLHREADRLSEEIADEQLTGFSFRGVSKPLPCCKDSNLAHRRNVIASSEETMIDNLASHAVDGDLSTRWCADGDQADEWLQVDLGEAQHVKAIRIHWEMMETEYSYRIESSADGRQWQQLVDTSDDPKAEHMPEHKVDAPGTRFLRVTFLGSDNGFWGSIREIEVSDAELAPPPNEAWEVIREEEDSFSDFTFFLGVER